MDSSSKNINSASHLNPQPEDRGKDIGRQDRQGDLNPQNQEEKSQQKQSVPFCQLFRFADKYDIIMMILGTFGALALGAATPVFIYLWGKFTDVFEQGGDAMVEQARKQLLQFIYIGIGAWSLGWLMIGFWVITGQRQAATCRKTYFRTLLRQDIGWFDCIDQSALSFNFSSDTSTFQGALGQKLALMLQALGTCIGGFSVAFSQGWLMALVCLGGFPVIAIATGIFMKSLQSKSKQFQKIYSDAGSQAQQACYSIKTVKQLNGEDYQHQKYIDLLDNNKMGNIKAGAKIALGFALVSASMFLLYSLGYWFGSHCVQGTSHCNPDISGGKYSPGTAITVFFSVLVACFYLGQLSPALKKIGEGMQAASRIYKVLDRQPVIKSPQNGKILQNCIGKIVFQNVSFSYPKDPSRKILNNISIEFDLNNTALVGQSGCGKSTILQLILRFYDPDQGRILLDGYDLRELNLAWLRGLIGYVGQEPVLFATSIRENLMLGNQHATLQDINQALQRAEAKQFIYQLQNKLDTYVGSGGGQLSGGQKQRIAIARALLKNPKILLLDEATSALDRKNEKLIQSTLNEISHGLTTITVAHRVKTIMNTDIVYVIDKGQIIQKGKFNSLQRYKNIPQEQQQEKQQGQIKQKQQLLVPQQVRQRKSSFAQKQAEKQKQKQQNKQLVAKHNKGIFRRTFGFLQKHRVSFVIGILLTMVNGLIYPIFSIFLSRIINALFYLSSSNPSTVERGRNDANVASLAFLLLAIGTVIFIFIRDLLTYVVGEQITYNIRKQAYRKILTMPVYWFDRTDNNCGILSTRLGTDCQTINGMATTYIYLVFQCLSTLIAALIIAFVFEWRTALVAIGTMPFIVLSGAIRGKFRTGQMEKMDKAYKDSALIVMESLTNIRTVVSFGVQNTVNHKYQRYLDGPQQSIRCSAVVSGFFFGMSQVTNFIAFGLMFYIGAIFMNSYGAELLDVFTVIYVILFAGLTIGNNTNFIPDIDQAKLAASHIFQILDAQDQNQLQVRQQSKMLHSDIQGHIVLSNVDFKYQSRQQYVFKKMNVEIRPGEKVAFVGPSGCGKSTIIQLLQRFYFPSSGQITIDGINIIDFDIHYLRSRFGVVSQEPALFNTSFRENIRYNSTSVTEQQIRMAAEEANALSFIEGTERIEGGNEENGQNTATGFDRNVGIKGSHISGGQKQRIAVARAILRNPQILLLDQATSALDAQNQKKVQESLDRIMKKKTTLTIAHRLQTIRNSDKINVFQKGEIVESGTYGNLLSRKGFFYNLEKGTQFV